MQRVLLNLGRAAPPVAVGTAGAAAHRASQQNGREPTSPTHLALQEEGEFMHVGFQGPVQHGEVAAALGELSALGGVTARRPLAGPAASAAASSAPALGPLIEEVDAESEASSECGSVDRLMASVDSVRPQFDRDNGAFDLLAETVTNVLNDDAVVAAISASLARDPAFVQLMSRVHAPGLPAPARMLLLEELEVEGELVGGNGAELAAPRGMHSGAGGDPLLHLLMGIQRGVATAAVHVGKAFQHVGNFLRGIGEHLRHALAGMEAGGSSAPQGSQPPAHSFEKAVLKVACAVAVVVLTRRVAVGRTVAAM